MDKLFLEIFGPFILVGTIYSLVVIFRKRRITLEEPEGEASREENLSANERGGGSDSSE